VSFDPRTDVPTLADLSPPYPDYPYYAGTAGPAFEPAAAAYSPVNAWWLAEASVLAYGGLALADRLPGGPNLLGRDGVRVAAVDGPDDNGVLVLSAAEFVIVAFRGTRVLGLRDPLALRESLEPHLRDVVTDLRFPQAAFDPGAVHAGFLAVYDEVATGLAARLDEVAGRPVWFTGHSLGGALATIAAARAGSFQGLYTFGSPRVGDETFANWFAGRPCYRVVHHDDVVPRLPPPLVPWRPPAVYRHVGQLVYIDRDGTVDPARDPATITDLPAGTIDLAGMLQSGLKLLGDLGKVLTHPGPMVPLPGVRVPRSGVTDHAPLYYARFLKDQLTRRP
jgi:hypothetical protein